MLGSHNKQKSQHQTLSLLKEMQINLKLILWSLTNLSNKKPNTLEIVTKSCMRQIITDESKDFVLSTLLIPIPLKRKISSSCSSCLSVGLTLLSDLSKSFFQTNTTFLLSKYTLTEKEEMNRRESRTEGPNLIREMENISLRKKQE